MEGVKSVYCICKPLNKNWCANPYYNSCVQVVAAVRLIDPSTGLSSIGESSGGGLGRPAESVYCPYSPPRGLVCVIPL